MSNVEDWHKIAEQMTLEGKTSTEIARYTGVKKDTVRCYIKRFRKRNGISRDVRGNVVSEEAKKINKKEPIISNKTTFNGKDGSYTYEQKIKIPKGTAITPELVLELNGLPAKDWEIVFFTFNSWQNFTNNDKVVEKVDLYQIKLQIKPRQKNEITFEDIDSFFKTKKFKNEPPIVKKFEEHDGLTLEIDIADLHCGLLSWRNETNNDFDLKICKKQLIECIDDIVNRAKRENIKKIYIASLGDLLHIDSDDNKTTKGTLQQADGRLPKIFDFAEETMEEVINRLLTLKVPIEFVNTCGNHDRSTNYFLVKVLDAVYKNNENVKFDILPRPMKVIHFGNITIGLCHGDMSKQNKGNWILNDGRKYLSDSKFIEEHSGHWHTEMLQQMRNGIMCRSVLSSCGTSYYEFQQGYRSQKGIQSFLWDDEKGLRSIWYYNL